MKSVLNQDPYCPIALSKSSKIVFTELQSKLIKVNDKRIVNFFVQSEQCQKLGCY